MQLRSLLVTLVRHGESQDNSQSIWAGFRDTPLSATGVVQARALGQAFANVYLTAIYASDLRRAAMTAEEILQANRSIPPPPLVQSKSLREQNFGQAEGKSWALAEWTAKSQSDEARTFRFKDGESLDDVNSRMAKAVRQFVLPRVEALRKQASASSSSSSASETPHICIVAHGIAIAELLKVFMSLHDEQPNSPWADPRLTYKRVRLDNTGWSRLELAVPVGSQETGRPSPQPPSLAPTPQIPAAPTASDLRISEGDAPDAGAVQADMVEGPSDATRPPQPAPEASTNQKLTFVRILCQNQTDHLRAFAIQPSNIAGGGAVHQLGGGLPPNAAAIPNSPSPNSLGQTAAGAGSNAVGPSNLPASGTMASIASHATLSTSASNATLPQPSTPGAGSIAAASRSINATPASSRSLNSYDVKMMTRELERAGAAAMLTGTESQTAISGSGTPATASQGHTIGSLASSAAATNSAPASERPSMQGPSAGLGTQASASGGSLFNSYTGAGGAGPAMSVSSPNTSSGFLNMPGVASDVWQSICVRVLPLFNGEGLRSNIEDLNDLVSQHVHRTLDRGPARALDALSMDLTSLAASGTLTLNSKLVGLEDLRLLVRLAEIWTFFLGQVLPYIQGCFLPFQTDPVLQSLTSNRRAVNVAAAQSALSPSLSSALRTEKINVRRILLTVFRDHVVLPTYERLLYLFAHIGEIDPAFSCAEDAAASDGSKQVYLRLMQMTSILASVLSDDDAQIAMDDLVRALRMGSKASAQGKGGTAGSDFGLGMRAMSPIQQRSNRRGWIAQRARKHNVGSMSDSFSLGSIAGGSSSMSASHHVPNNLGAVRSVPVTTINRFGRELTEDDYLSALRSPNEATAMSTPGQPRPPISPQGQYATDSRGLSDPRHSEESSRTAAPGQRNVRTALVEGDGRHPILQQSHDSPSSIRYEPRGAGALPGRGARQESLQELEDDGGATREGGDGGGGGELDVVEVGVLRAEAADKHPSFLDVKSASVMPKPGEGRTSTSTSNSISSNDNRAAVGERVGITAE
ncbi:hypothetical protein ACQY0O_005747 [Thecaphora frezii]